MEGERILVAGIGRTTSISSSSIVFECERPLPAGMLVELAVTWPVRLDNTVRLRLHILGRTVRAMGNFTAIDILRHEFRTVATQDNARSPAAVSAPAARTMAAAASPVRGVDEDVRKHTAGAGMLGVLVKTAPAS